MDTEEESGSDASDPTKGLKRGVKSGLRTGITVGLIIAAVILAFLFWLYDQAS